MHALPLGDRAWRAAAGGAVTQPVPPAASPSRGAVEIPAETYARLLSLADQAPLECLPLTPRTLARAKTLGYNVIGQIRSTPSHRLLADLGTDLTAELQRVLHDFGLRQNFASSGD